MIEEWVPYAAAGWLLLVWLGVRSVRSALKEEAEEAERRDR